MLLWKNPGCICSGYSSGSYRSGSSYVNGKKVVGIFQPIGDCWWTTETELQQCFENYNRMSKKFISAKINSKFGRVLIDSGATYSVINESHARQINAKFKPLAPGLPTKLFVANGQPIFISSSAEVNLNIEIANFVCNVLVARDLSVSAHLILGTYFLQIHKAILNFDDHTLTLV